MILVLYAGGIGYAIHMLGVSHGSAESTQPEFDGTPRFMAIQGTVVQYATNTSSTVLRAGQHYYLFRDELWFRGPSPTGPYSKTDGTPAESCEAPAESDY